MELDELKQAWNRNDERLERLLVINRALLREAQTERTRTSLNSLSWMTIAAMVADAVLLIVIGSFLAHHVAQARFFIPALVLHIAAIASFGALVYQVVRARSIDFSTPVVAIQKELAGIRMLRIRMTQWTFLVAPLLWLPMLIVLLKTLGVDAYQMFSQRWLVANALFGVMFLVVMWIVSRRYASRIASSRFTQRLMDDIAGRSLNDAASFLQAARNFEDETRT